MESQDSTDSIDSLGFINSIDSILVSHNTKDRKHSHHTQRGARCACANKDAAPIGTVVFPFVCGVNVGGLLCGTSIESIESIKSIESIESVESSDSIESIESIQSIDPIETTDFLNHL